MYFTIFLRTAKLLLTIFAKITPMPRQKLFELYKQLEAQVKNAERIARATKDAANELSHAAIASPSTSGDREHATNAAYINQEKLVKLIALKDEVGEAMNEEIPKKIEPVCYFNGYYLVSKPMYLRGFSLISPESLLGKSILGKKAGESYEYKSESGQKISGVITAIE